MTEILPSLTSHAKALAADVAARAWQCEELRRPPDATIDAFKEAGFFKIMRPKRYGGYELGPRELREVVLAACTGCGSSAWVLTLVAYHPWFVALLSEEGQEEIFSSAADMLAPVVFAPNAKAIPVDGGYRISGQWAFSTGSSFCNWVGMGASVATEAAPRHIMVFMPREDVTILDTWYSTGLRGTASADTLAEDVFVPTRRAMDFGPMWVGSAAGAALHESWIYRAPMRGFLSQVGLIPAFALIRGMIDAFAERAQHRVKLYSGARQRDDSSTQIRLARAHAAYDACWALMDRDLADLERYVVEEDYGDLVRRMNYRMHASYIVETLRQISTDLLVVSGASAMDEKSPIQRAHRDIHAIAAHHAYVYDAVSEVAGKVRLGIEEKIESI